MSTCNERTLNYNSTLTDAEVHTNLFGPSKTNEQQDGMNQGCDHNSIDST